MTELSLAIAVSARAWADRMRHFLADHGGARVRVSAMGPEDLFGEAFDVLFIDDICSFLTPRLVDLISSGGRRVVGVYDPSEFSDGKERLLECGVADVIESAASPDEMLAVALRVTSESRRGAPASVPEVSEHEPSTPATVVGSGSDSALIAVGGPSGGTGATEVAIAVASYLAGRGPSVLVDCDDNAPSIAQRLGLPLHPNIRTAVDVLEHRSGILDRVLHHTDRPGLTVLPGLASVGDWAELRPRQITDLLRTLTIGRTHVVANIGSRIDGSGFGEGLERSGMSRTVVGMADMVVAVGSPTPIGVARLLEWVSLAQTLKRTIPIHVLINRAPLDRFRQGEILQELTRTYQPASFVFLPHDPNVEEAAWAGTLADRGKFRKIVDRWADSFVPVVSR